VAFWRRPKKDTTKPKPTLVESSRRPSDGMVHHAIFLDSKAICVGQERTKICGLIRVGLTEENTSEYNNHFFMRGLSPHKMEIKKKLKIALSGCSVSSADTNYLN